MRHPLAQDYSWLAQDYPQLNEDYCISYLKGVPPEEALRRIGAVPDRIRPFPVADALEEQADNGDAEPLTAHAVQKGEWTVLVEPSGCQGIDPSVAERASAGTEMVAVWALNANAETAFLYAVEGTTRVHFEPLRPQEDLGASNPLDADMRAVGLDPEQGPDLNTTAPDRAALALAERITGVRLESADLSGEPLGAELAAAAGPES